MQSDYSCKIFSKLRSSIGGLYAWHAERTADTSEKKRMNDEADFAFRQAFTLCPYSPEVMFRYVQLLANQKRMGDALLIAETVAKMPSMKGRDGDQVRSLVEQLERYRKPK